MTKGDKVRSWDDLKLAQWFALVEKAAIEYRKEIKSVSEDDLIKDWIEFLSEEEEDNENNS